MLKFSGWSAIRDEYMINLKSRKKSDKRNKARKNYSGHILFTTKNGFFEGRLINYSNDGLYIETKASLSVGDIITIALPYVQGKQTKCRGQIMRCDKKGFGIELFKKRQLTNLRVIK